MVSRACTRPTVHTRGPRRPASGGCGVWCTVYAAAQHLPPAGPTTPGWPRCRRHDLQPEHRCYCGLQTRPGCRRKRGRVRRMRQRSAHGPPAGFPFAAGPAVVDPRLARQARRAARLSLSLHGTIRQRAPGGSLGGGYHRLTRLPQTSRRPASRRWPISRAFTHAVLLPSRPRTDLLDYRRWPSWP